MGTLPLRSGAQSRAGQLLGISSAPAGAGAAQCGGGKAQGDHRAQRTELGSFSSSQCQEETRGTGWNTEMSEHQEELFCFLPCGWWSTDTDCPERCWGLLLGDLLKPPGRGAAHPARGDPPGAGVGPEGPRGASGLSRAVVLRDQRPALAGLILPQDGSQPAARGTNRSPLRFLWDRVSVLCPGRENTLALPSLAAHLQQRPAHRSQPLGCLRGPSRHRHVWLKPGSSSCFPGPRRRMCCSQRCAETLSLIHI